MDTSGTGRELSECFGDNRCTAATLSYCYDLTYFLTNFCPRRNAEFNFDTLWNGFLATFTFTAGGWGGMVLSLTEVTDIDYNTKYNNSPANVIFIMVSSTPSTPPLIHVTRTALTFLSIHDIHTICVHVRSAWRLLFWILSLEPFCGYRVRDLRATQSDQTHRGGE